MEGYEMTLTDQQNIYTQRQWTDQELIGDGFLSYRPVKSITMMRMLAPEKALEDIENSDNAITTRTRSWMPYVGGDALKEALEDYDPRPIEADIFAATYRPWDESDWRPTPTEAHLQQLGCMPYYKVASVWAKQLTAETRVQGKGSTEPLLAPVGAWLCVDSEGEPWSETDAKFHAHYHLPKQKKPTRV
jgi:hypothetical protein